MENSFFNNSIVNTQSYIIDAANLYQERGRELSSL